MIQSLSLFIPREMACIIDFSLVFLQGCSIVFSPKRPKTRITLLTKLLHGVCFKNAENEVRPVWIKGLVAASSVLVVVFALEVSLMVLGAHGVAPGAKTVAQGERAWEILKNRFK